MAAPVDPIPFMPGETRLARALLRPRALALACIVALAGLGWVYLGLMAGAAAQAGHGLGPGMGLIDLIATGQLDAASRALLEALCRPTFGRAAHAGIAAGPWGAGDFALVYLMWSAMTFAMMLPTAGPMVLAYAEIAETAAAKGEGLVSPLTLTAGYMAVWLGFAIVATGLQWSLTRLALLDPGLVSASALFSGAIFIAAGAYQFSPLKHACLTVCQRPFPYLFARWSGEPGAVFRLGLTQGLYCLGCCLAMMLAMFAIGVMNVVWMAALGVVMAAEKTTATARFSRAIGTVFIAVGIVFVVSSMIEHWPARAG